MITQQECIKEKSTNFQKHMEKELTYLEQSYAEALKKAWHKVKIMHKKDLPLLMNRLDSKIPFLRKNAEDLLVYWLVKNL